MFVVMHGFLMRLQQSASGVSRAVIVHGGMRFQIFSSRLDFLRKCILRLLKNIWIFMWISKLKGDVRKIFLS
ncbi:hypothetical protein DZC76_09505 [Pseudomonas sp. phDV1]|nr:hypothetical protein DZC76_09505 [Pseudomonas sp. phDV1]